MAYKANQTWKDLVEGPEHHAPSARITRRDLLRYGLMSSVLSFTLPDFLLRNSNNAYAQLACPPITQTPGAIAQIYAQGGPTMGARFIGADQAAMMTPTIASNYGISGTNLLQLGTNLVIDTTSPFGATLMAGPPGFAGGAAGWQSTVLNKISGGGHRGPFTADDGAGANTGLLGGASPFKTSQLGKDLQIGISNKMATWAGGLPASSVSGNKLTPQSLATVFSMTPASTGLATSQTMTDAANAAAAIAAAMGPTFNMSNRNGSATLTTSSGCALLGNSAFANPSFGTSLFDPTQITALTSTLTVSALSLEEQSQLSSYYQSALGTIGGVILELGGRDYHGQDPQTVIAPADIEEARAIVMFLAACNAAKTKGSFLYFANGQAIASGVQSVTASIGGTPTTLNAPVAKGDAGGSYNAGLIIFYDPNGAPPAATITGTLSSNNGNVQASSAITSSATAVSGLYLSALAWINGGTPPAAAVTAMGVSSAATIMVI